MYKYLRRRQKVAEKENLDSAKNENQETTDIREKTPDETLEDKIAESLEDRSGSVD